MENINLSKLDENQILKLINLGFSYFDLTNIQYDDMIQKFLEETSNKLKISELKIILKYFIELIVKDLAENTIQKVLSNLNISKENQKRFLELKYENLQLINKMSLSLCKKIFDNKLLNFSYSFYINFGNVYNDKVEFCLKITINYKNNNGIFQTIILELSISKFYQLLNDLNKIETIFKTLL